MKVGDKLMWKKESDDFFENGKIYPISIITKDLKSNKKVYSVNTYKKMLDINDNSNIIHFTDNYIFEFFYSPKELRNMKLRKLENV